MEGMGQHISYSVAKWSDINIKEKIAIVSACVTLFIGWLLVCIGFMIHPQGEVHDSVLWILGQALIYSASVFGLAGYMTSQVFTMKRDINDHLHRMEELQIERERLRNGVDYGEVPSKENDE